MLAEPRKEEREQPRGEEHEKRATSPRSTFKREKSAPSIGIVERLDYPEQRKWEVCTAEHLNEKKKFKAPGMHSNNPGKEKKRGENTPEIWREGAIEKEPLLSATRSERQRPSLAPQKGWLGPQTTTKKE